MTALTLEIKDPEKRMEYAEIHGFLAPRFMSQGMADDTYQVVGPRGQKYLLKKTPLWEELLRRLCWESVIVGGHYDKTSGVIDLLYIFKSDRRKRVTEQKGSRGHFYSNGYQRAA